MSRLRVGLVYDLRDDYLAAGYSPQEVAEFDSGETIEALAGGLERLGYAVERVGNGKALCRRLARGDRWDLVFSIAEGISGRSREAQVPALLELFEVPYAFSDPLTCAVTLDKAAAKRLVRAAGLRTPRFEVVRCPDDLARVRLACPVFVKPLAEGTSKGIDGRNRVDALQELRETVLGLLERFSQPVLVEEYLPGREFTTGIVGTGPAARVLGTMEIRVRPDAPAADYSYAVKENYEAFVEYTSLGAGPLRRSVEDLARRAYEVLECRDVGRVDTRLDARGRPSFLEINPLPGLHPVRSDLPMIAAQQGMTYIDLLAEIVASALERTRGASSKALTREGV